MRNLIKNILRESEFEWIEDTSEPFIVTTQPFSEDEESRQYWVSTEPIEVGDFVVYKTASGIWREHGKIWDLTAAGFPTVNDDPDYYKVVKFIPPNRPFPMKESEGLEWIDDIAMNPNPEEGDTVIVHNMGSEKAFRTWLGDYKDEYLSGRLTNEDGNIEGKVIGYHQTDEGSTFIVQTKGYQQVYFPKVDNQGMITGTRYRAEPENYTHPYYGFKVRYEVVLKENINESEDFEWIKNVSPREDGDLMVGDIIYIGEKDDPMFLLEIINLGLAKYFTDYMDHPEDIGPDVPVAVYEILQSNNDEEPEGSIQVIELDLAKRLITKIHPYWFYMSKGNE